MGVASLVLGIVGLVLSCTGSVGWLGSILGVIAIVLGAVGRKNPEKKSIATGGLVCGIIALVLGIISYVACVACIGGAATAFSDLL